jgi:hypothetical protein
MVERGFRGRSRVVRQGRSRGADGFKSGICSNLMGADSRDIGFKRCKISKKVSRKQFFSRKVLGFKVGLGFQGRSGVST